MSLWKNLIYSAAVAATVATAPAAIVINEVDADQAGTDSAEFVELFNPTGSPVNLGTGQFVLVLYNGSNDQSYGAVDLTGTIGANDYYVVGAGTVPNVDLIPSGFPATDAIQNGQDAVALYSGTTAAAFPNGTVATATNIVDAIVYDTSDADDLPLIATLTPGQPQIDENGLGSGTLHSNQRVPDGGGGALNTGSYTQATPTPGTSNTAPVGPVATPNVTAVDFGSFNEANAIPVTRTVRLTNTGTGNLTITDFDIQAGSDTQFTATAPTSLVVAAGASSTITVSFTNSNVASDQVFTGTVEYTTDGGNGTIPLTATFVRVLQTASAGQVVLNELVYNPNPAGAPPIVDYNGDGIAEANQDEFVELYNTTGSPINVQGWEITATSGTPTPIVDTEIIPAGTMIPANGWIVLFGGGTPTGFGPGVAFVGIPALGNSGEILSLSDNTTEIDEVAFAGEEANNGAGTDAGVTSEGGSIGLFPDGILPYIEFPYDSVSTPPSPGFSNGTVTAVNQFESYR